MVTKIEVPGNAIKSGRVFQSPDRLSLQKLLRRVVGTSIILVTRLPCNAVQQIWPLLRGTVKFIIILFLLFFWFFVMFFYFIFLLIFVLFFVSLFIYHFLLIILHYHFLLGLAVYFLSLLTASSSTVSYTHLDVYKRQPCLGDL